MTNCIQKTIGFAAAFVASVCLSGIVTGCGANLQPAIIAPVVNASAAAMGGTLYGGINPVVGASLTLYATANTGYGGAATKLATTSTDSQGQFNFTLGTNFSCPAGQFAYVTAYGGNSGANTVNNAILLMVPVGACESNYTGNVYVGQYLNMNELTSVAAAYALSGFMTIDTSGSSPIVNISSPANNNAPAPCVAGSGACTTTAAAGLKHAFATAMALVNVNTGVPNSTNAHGGVLPSYEINLLGDILQSCVNSKGVTGTNTATSNDGSGCGQLFSFTTPPNAPSAVPTNTLQAVLNLAHFPNPLLNTWNTTCNAAGSGTTSATTCLFNLVSSASAYPSALTAAPPDWALAIVYPKGTAVNTTTCPAGSTCSGLSYPYALALDISDDIYVANSDTSSQATLNLIGLQFDGTPIFTGANDSTYPKVKAIATDGLGNVITANNVSSGSPVINVYSGASGTLLESIPAASVSPYTFAVDPFNNVWYASSTANLPLQKLNYVSTTAGVPQYSPATFTNSPVPSQGIYQLGFDSLLNLYAEGNGSPSSIFMEPNTGTVASPSYGGTIKSVATTGSTSSAFGLAVSGTGDAYTINSVGLTKISRSGTGDSSVLTAGTPVTVPAVNGSLYSRYGSLDGLNTFYSADQANGSVVTGVSVYDNADGLALGTYKGCKAISSSNRTCGTGSTSSPAYGVRGAVIDSAGNIWIASGTGGALSEFIGSAAPTWPALSAVKFGRPQ